MKKDKHLIRLSGEADEGLRKLRKDAGAVYKFAEKKMKARKLKKMKVAKGKAKGKKIKGKSVKRKKKK
jgi:hypothetical protein